MPTNKRNKTRYPGVVWVAGTDPRGPKRVYYMIYRRDGRQVEEPAAGPNMTPRRASDLRALKARKVKSTNSEKREKRKKQAAVEKWTFDLLWDAYCEYRKDEGPYKGIVTDKNRFELHIKPHLGKKAPSELIQFDVERIKRKKRAPQTIKNILSLLQRLVNYGVKKKRCVPPDFEIGTLKGIDNVKDDALTAAQLKRLLDVLDKSKDVAVASMMKLAVYTGMRRGEIFKLQWGDVDFERNFINIRSPKGGESTAIPLNASARKVLKSVPRTDSEYLFPGRNGGPRMCAKRASHEIREAAGLPDDFRPFHGLRHTYATMMASSGRVDMYTLQKLLTHKSPQMTQRYAHLRDEALRGAADLVGDLVGEQVAKAEAAEKERSEKNAG
jgi:integrase